jgi:hypothetical protein
MGENIRNWRANSESADSAFVSGKRPDSFRAERSAVSQLTDQSFPEADSRA